MYWARDRGIFAVGLSDLRGHAVRLFRERLELMAELHRDGRDRLGHRLEQRLERILRDDLIGLERHRAVGGGVAPGLGLRHRGVRHLEQRRPHQVEQQIGVHRPVRRVSGGTDGLGNAEAAEDFHRPRIAALHLRIAERRVVLLHQRAADAAFAEIDGERQPDRTSPNDENLRIHSILFDQWPMIGGVALLLDHWHSGYSRHAAGFYLLGTLSQNSRRGIICRARAPGVGRDVRRRMK
jgi:hypothetical protein